MNKIAYNRMMKVDFHLAMATSMLKALRHGSMETYETTDTQVSIIASVLEHCEEAMERMWDVYKEEGGQK